MFDASRDYGLGCGVGNLESSYMFDATQVMEWGVGKDTTASESTTSLKKRHKNFACCCCLRTRKWKTHCKFHNFKSKFLRVPKREIQQGTVMVHKMKKCIAKNAWNPRGR